MKQQATGMKLGMLLAIAGGVILLVIGVWAQANMAVIGGFVGWGCGAATAIYASANGAIKKLNQRIVELEEQSS